MNKVATLINATKEYKMGDSTIYALQETNFTLEQQALTVILGPSGSGKTTLLSLLGCVIYPTAGSVWVQEKNTSHLSSNELAKLRLHEIGFVFQGFNLLQPLTAEQNIALPLELMKRPSKEIKKRTTDALEKVNMLDRRHNLPKQLSGGQQQRVAIARALITKPSIILCDEPTAALDIKSLHNIMDELKQLAKEGAAVAVVTHDTRLTPYANKIVLVNDGKISYQPIPSSQIT